MSMPAPPPDNRAAGQQGHLADHNLISDVLTALENQCVRIGGDIGGTVDSPEVLKIQGTPIDPPPGGTTEFLRGNGTWGTPSGGGGSGADFWLPADDGILAANADPADCYNSTIGGSDMGILWLSRWIIRSPVTLNDLLIAWDANSLTTPSGSAYLGLYSPSGASAPLVAHTGDLGSLFIADYTGPATCRIQAPLSSPASLAAGTYLAGFLVPSGWGGSGPSLMCKSPGGLFGSAVNWGTLPGNFRCGSYGSGLSTLPGTLTLSSIVDPTGAVTPIAQGPFWIGGR